MQINDKHTYVATEHDIDAGGFIDANPDDFGYPTREEANAEKEAFERYAKEEGYENVKFYIEEP